MGLSGLVDRALFRRSSKRLEAAVRARNLTYLDEEKFESLRECVALVKQRAIPGDFIEFGVALGGSGIYLAHQLGRTRQYFGLDVFGMIPPPTTTDGDDVRARYETIVSGSSEGINGDRYYGYVENLHDVVKANFAAFALQPEGGRVHLIKGLFSETIPSLTIEVLALAHIDCDWYEPVKECLAYAWHRLAVGGFIVLDDYNDWKGCGLATDEFLRENPRAEIVRLKPHAVITKGSRA